jgi:4-carboxymuconolactone decarboxylase
VSAHDDRLRPQQPRDWNDQTATLLGGGGTDAKPLNILNTIAHHPSLLEPFLGFAATLAIIGTLPRRESELLALRAAFNCRSDFEWGHHVIYARDAGLSDDEIARVAHGPAAKQWSDADRELLTAADELHAHQDLSPTTWTELRARWSDAQLVEIPFVVGNYTMLSMVANATGVPLEDDVDTLPPPG